MAKVRPMLATLVEEPFDRTGWIFEIKWDGYRAIAALRRGRGKTSVSLASRHGQDFSGRYRPVAEALEKIRHDAVLDGEVVVLDASGASSFQRLQKYEETRKGRLVYVVFDLLSLDGRDLRKEPLSERKRLLKRILPISPALKFSEHVESRGAAFFEAAKRKGLEGIMAKDAGSPYREGVRGRDWLKIKAKKRQEVVVGGFTEPRRARKFFGALVVGVHEGGVLKYVGHTGGGFDFKGLKAVYAKLKRLERKASPFSGTFATNAPVHWVQPVMVAEVEFAGWTDDGIMRQPIFVGLRDDKPAREVIREIGRTPQPKLQPPKKKEAYANLAKVYWPDEGYTKGEVIAYYREVAPVMLPHLKDRPMSLNRHPDGIEGKHFFQKDVGMLHLPAWLKTVPIALEKGTKKVVAPVCQNAKTLLHLANLGCIEMNTWDSRIAHLDKPDYMIIDLDPEGVPFRKVVEVARAVHEAFEELGVPNVCKTSGGRGLHVYVPLGAKYDYAQAREFAELTAALVGRELPDLTSVERLPRRRQGKVYFDFLQNKFGATNVAVYSLRPRPHAPVSTPLKWPEVKPGLDPTAFNIKTMPKRLDKVGDLFAPVLGKGVDLGAVLGRLKG